MSQISSPASSTLPDRSSTSTMLASDAKPPKSKTEPYYSVHPVWTNLTPIPQMDLNQPSTYTSGTNPLSVETADRLASTGPALATIAYTPRYIEAMSYLRAAMAKEEYSERALALTEDIIGMNPAHYTVWIYRFRILKELWGPFSAIDGEGRDQISDTAKAGFDHELKWLEKISEKNLKNYQIWHHRQSLFQLLPLKPAPASTPWLKALLNAEPIFIRGILELDTKNYHVWSYRQWLCAHFPEHYLADNSKEVAAMDLMIQEDVMNNSAWNHRYFIVFGSKEILREQKRTASLIDMHSKGTTTTKTTAPEAGTTPTTTTTTQPLQVHEQQEENDDDEDDNADIVDLDIVDRELDYTKTKIRLAPQNGSTWNYLKGILKYADTPVTDLKDFCAEFVGTGFTFDVLHNQSENVKGVRSSQAVEMCVNIFAAEADASTDAENARDKVRQGLNALSTKWDPIRRRYWDWRLKGYEQRWKK